MPDRPAALLCTYWGRERGARTFDVLVDNHVIATTVLDSNHAAAFYDLTHPIPRALTDGKKRVTVKFQAHPGNTAGGLFGVRVVRPKTRLSHCTGPSPMDWGHSFSLEEEAQSP